MCYKHKFVGFPHTFIICIHIHLFPVDSLCAELASLLQEAMDMKWPFVPEKWQYKQAVSTEDKTNLSDLIKKHLSQLLVTKTRLSDAFLPVFLSGNDPCSWLLCCQAVLKASIVAREAHAALAVVFLVDRFLYWTDESSRLLKITKLLHRCHPDTPVAPQLVIRQARVYFNSGAVWQRAAYFNKILSFKGSTWH